MFLTVRDFARIVEFPLPAHAPHAAPPTVTMQSIAQPVARLYEMIAPPRSA
jgi:hypothetical protein